MGLTSTYTDSWLPKVFTFWCWAPTWCDSESVGGCLKAAPPLQACAKVMINEGQTPDSHVSKGALRQWFQSTSMSNQFQLKRVTVLGPWARSDRVTCDAPLPLRCKGVLRESAVQVASSTYPASRFHRPCSQSASSWSMSSGAQLLSDFISPPMAAASLCE